MYNTKLGDAVNSIPRLKTAVEKHIAQLDAAEASGTKAKEFLKTAETATAEAAKAQGVAAKAGEAKRAYEAELVRLRQMSPREMADNSESIIKVFKDARAKNVISKETFDELLKQTKKLKTNVGVKNMLLKTAAGGAGLFVASKVGSEFLTSPSDNALAK